MTLKTSPEAPTSSILTCGGTMVEEPVTLEMVCLEWIGQLDASLTKVAEHRATGRYGEASAAGKQMLLAVLDYAETNLEGDALQAVQQRVADAYDRCKEIDDAVSARGWRVVRRALRRPTATDEHLPEKCEAVGEAIALSVITAVAGGESQFQSGSPEARQMAERLKALIEKLKTSW